MASGAGLKQVVVEPASVPGGNNSCYSAKQTVTVTTAGTGTNSVITDIGELLFMPTTNIKVELQDPFATWTTVVASGTTSAFQIFSDGTNLRFNSNDTTTNRTGSYYIIQ